MCSRFVRQTKDFLFNFVALKAIGVQKWGQKPKKQKEEESADARRCWQNKKQRLKIFPGFSSENDPNQFLFCFFGQTATIFKTLTSQSVANFWTNKLVRKLCEFFWKQFTSSLPPKKGLKLFHTVSIGERSSTAHLLDHAGFTFLLRFVHNINHKDGRRKLLARNSHRRGWLKV